MLGRYILVVLVNAGAVVVEVIVRFNQGVYLAGPRLVYVYESHEEATVLYGFVLLDRFCSYQLYIFHSRYAISVIRTMNHRCLPASRPKLWRKAERCRTWNAR
jgi:hypothetical protein